MCGERASVTFADITDARRLLAGVARVTPIHGSRGFSELVGGPVWLKCENLQRAGSFKIRGAFTRISRIPEEQRARGVVAASAGNHAQGVALAASLLGTAAVVFMPEGATIPKVEATRGYGAQVRFAGRSVDEAMEAAQQYAQESGAAFISPFDHPDVVAGQGTVGLEILDQCPDVRTVVVSTGGGGLVAGTAVALAGSPRARARPVRVVGVQAEGAASYRASLAAGHPVRLERLSTIADGIAVGRPGEVTFPLVRDLVDEVRTVSDESLSQAVLLLLERAKLVVEPAGAAAIAGILEAPEAFEPPVVAVLSGGNVDPLLLMRLLRHGLAGAGRFVSMRVRLGDRPGALAGLLAAVAATDASVVEVAHLRTGPELGVDEADVWLQVETRGSAHSEELTSALWTAGYRVTLW